MPTRQYLEPNKFPFLWEYYGRISCVIDKINKLGLNNYTILDVGGGKDNLFKKFNMKNLITLDIKGGADIRGDADKIPFKDNTFEIVTCIDTLEHLKTNIRTEVVKELVRVSKYAVFIVAPIDSKYNNKAEQIVLKYHKNEFILQHQKEGLVNFSAIKKSLSNVEKIINIDEQKIDNLLTWVILMTKDFIDPSHVYQEAYFLENKYIPRRCLLSLYLN